MPERWPLVERIYSAVVARPESEWATALVDLCAGDDELRNEVESLLAHDQSARTFLEAAVFASADVAGDITSERAIVGRRFGPHAVVAPLGSGGMAEVYRARDEQLGREIAIKILPAHFASDPDRRARVEREARMLAALNHPHIGAIYGLEDVDGCPALVLRQRKGETITQADLAMSPAGVPGSQRTGGQSQVGVERRHLEPSDRQPLQSLADDPLVIGVHPYTHIGDFSHVRCREHATRPRFVRPVTAGPAQATFDFRSIAFFTTV